MLFQTCKLLLLLLGLNSQVVLGRTIIQVLNEEGATKLVELLEKTDLLSTIASITPLTLFAPTNEAFDELPDDLVGALNDTDLMRTILLSHVVPTNQVFFEQLHANQVVHSAGPNGELLRINIYLKSKFYQGYMTVNGKRISKANLRADDDQSVIHLATEVIPTVQPDHTIAQALQLDDRFSTLLTALQVADLVDALDTPDGNFSLFAPTNAAFDKLDKETLDSLLHDDHHPSLVELLQRHIVQAAERSMTDDPMSASCEVGKTSSILFRRGISWRLHQTLNGEQDTIQTQVYKNGMIKVANDKMTRADLKGEELVVANGVIHAIDTVI